MPAPTRPTKRSSSKSKRKRAPKKRRSPAKRKAAPKRKPAPAKRKAASKRKATPAKRKGASKRHLTATQKREQANPRKAKRKAAKRKKSTKLSRSEAAKKSWRNRKTRALLLEKLDFVGFRQTELPTTYELYDYMEWFSKTFDVEIGTAYELYFGYKDGEGFSVNEPVEVWDQ